jgi:hypothetical protein
MKTVLIVFIFFLLASCASGPVYIAKTEQEGLKTSYPDARLTDLSREHHAILKDIYQRLQRAKVDVYPGGIGFTTLTDEHGKKLNYLLVQVRPQDITFAEGKTTPQVRFGEVFERHFEKHLKRITKMDLAPDNIDGLAFGIYWPVRDLTQCDTYGGFLEYTIMYLKEAEFIDLMNGEITFSEAAKDAEIVTSLGLQKPDYVTVKE